MFPVGRLDLDTEGLLLLTNDGELAELLTHPRHGVEKEYLAEVEGMPSPRLAHAARQGVELDDGPVPAVRAQVVQKSTRRVSAVEITVKVGRKRIVRRMCAEIGHPVRRLVRTRSGRCPTRSSRRASGVRSTAVEVRALYVAGLDERRGTARLTCIP